jgi:hypothetical protein
MPEDAAFPLIAAEVAGVGELIGLTSMGSIPSS